MTKLILAGAAVMTVVVFSAVISTWAVIYTSDVSGQIQEKIEREREFLLKLFSNNNYNCWFSYKSTYWFSYWFH